MLSGKDVELVWNWLEDSIYLDWVLLMLDRFCDGFFCDSFLLFCIYRIFFFRLFFI